MGILFSFCTLDQDNEDFYNEHQIITNYYEKYLYTKCDNCRASFQVLHGVQIKRYDKIFTYCSQECIPPIKIIEDYI